jgi:hypothetical protein
VTIEFYPGTRAIPVSISKVKPRFTVAFRPLSGQPTSHERCVLFSFRHASRMKSWWCTGETIAKRL